MIVYQNRNVSRTGKNIKIKGGLPPGLGEREASIVLVEERKMGFVLMILRNIYLYVHKPLLV